MKTFFKLSSYKFFSLLLLFLSPLVGFGQDLNTAEKQQNIDNLANADFRGMVRAYDTRYEGVMGSPFFVEDWISGEVALENGSRYTGLELRYDVYNDQVIGRKKDQKEVVIDKSIIKSFTLGKNGMANMANFTKAAHLEADIKGLDKDQFVQILYDGDGVLYAVNKKMLSKANYKGAYNSGKTYDEFTALNADYYYADPDGKMHEIKPKRSHILKTFKDQKDALAAYMDDRDLDLSQRDDLVELMMFYTSQVN